MRKLALIALFIMLAAFSFLGPQVGSALAGQDMVDLCHVTGNGSYQLISVAEPAVEAHLNHGDVEPDGKGNCGPIGDPEPCTSQVCDDPPE